MKRQTSAIVALLHQLTEDIYYSLVGDELYNIIIWETDKQGVFTLENFLVNQKALTLFTTEEFLQQIEATQSTEVSQKYQQLIDLLQENLSELVLYSYSFPYLSKDIFSGEKPIEEIDTINIPIILGLSQQGEWIGMMLKQNFCGDSSSELLIPNPPFIGDNTTQLLEEIKTILNTLKHQMKSSSWELKDEWEITLTSHRNTIIEKLLTQTNFVSINNDMEEFWRIEEKKDEIFDEEIDIDIDNEMPEDLRKEIDLKDYFENQLSNSRLYYLDYIVGGETFTIHYILGKTEDNDWMGLMTDSFTF